MNPPRQDPADFMRLRINRRHEVMLEELKALLNQTTPSSTIEWILDRHLMNEIREAREFKQGRNDEND